MEDTESRLNVPANTIGIKCPNCNYENHSVINCISYVRCWKCGQVLKGKENKYTDCIHKL